MHQQSLSHGHFFHGHHQGLPFAYHVCHIGPQVHQMADAMPALPLGIVLAECSYPVEQHHRHGLGKLCLGSGQESYGESSQCGYGHEQVFIEDVAMQDAFDGFPQGSACDKQIGGQVHQQLLPSSHREASLHPDGHSQQDDGEDDACSQQSQMLFVSVMMMVVMMMSAAGVLLCAVCMYVCAHVPMSVCVDLY